jgi:hypothetical protein
VDAEGGEEPDIAVTELRAALADGKRTGRLDSLTVASLERVSR